MKLNIEINKIGFSIKNQQTNNNNICWLKMRWSKIKEIKEINTCNDKIKYNIKLKSIQNIMNNNIFQHNYS